MYFYVAHVCLIPEQVREAIGIPELWMVGGCHVGDGSQTHIICRNKCSLLLGCLSIVRHLKQIRNKAEIKSHRKEFS